MAAHAAGLLRELRTSMEFEYPGDSKYLLLFFFFYLPFVIFVHNHVDMKWKSFGNLQTQERK